MQTWKERLVLAERHVTDGRRAIEHQRIIRREIGPQRRLMATGQFDTSGRGSH
jgi:hypothetical protein